MTAENQGSTKKDQQQEPDLKGEGSARRYPPTFGEQRRGITEVVLPLGSPEAIDRLARDIMAFGYGMGEAEPCSSAQLAWMEKAEAARAALMGNVRAHGRESRPCALTTQPSTSLHCGAERCGSRGCRQ